MSAKWLLIAMAIIIVMTFFLLLIPDGLSSTGNTFFSEIAPFTADVNIGIAAAVLCIALFLLYTIVIKRRKH